MRDRNNNSVKYYKYRAIYRESNKDIELYVCIYVQYTYTRMGRKIETDYMICSFLTTSYLGHSKPSFHCVRKLFTILNSLRIGN